MGPLKKGRKGFPGPRGKTLKERGGGKKFPYLQRKGERRGPYKKGRENSVEELEELFCSNWGGEALFGEEKERKKEGRVFCRREEEDAAY